MAIDTHDQSAGVCKFVLHKKLSTGQLSYGGLLNQSCLNNTHALFLVSAPPTWKVSQLSKAKACNDSMHVQAEAIKH